MKSLFIMMLLGMSLQIFATEGESQIGQNGDDQMCTELVGAQRLEATKTDVGAEQVDTTATQE